MRGQYWLLITVTHERKCQSWWWPLMTPTCCHVSRVTSHSICQSEANCNNTSDGETSCFNPLFVNGLSTTGLSFVPLFVRFSHFSPEIALYVVALSSVVFCSVRCVTLSAPQSPTERRWALIQYCDIISSHLLFPQHYFYQLPPDYIDDGC